MRLYGFILLPLLPSSKYYSFLPRGHRVDGQAVRKREDFAHIRLHVGLHLMHTAQHAGRTGHYTAIKVYIAREFRAYSSNNNKH